MMRNRCKLLLQVYKVTDQSISLKKVTARGSRSPLTVRVRFALVKVVFMTARDRKVPPGPLLNDVTSWGCDKATKLTSPALIRVLWLTKRLS